MTHPLTRPARGVLSGATARTGPPPVERPAPLREAVYDALVEMIITAELQPGEHLVENDLVAVKYQTNWQWKTQLTFLRSVEFGAVEARANDMQFCLRECAFHAEDKAVVEVGRIVSAISVEHQSFGDSAQFQ